MTTAQLLAQALGGQGVQAIEAEDGTELRDALGNIYITNRQDLVSKAKQSANLIPFMNEPMALPSGQLPQYQVQGGGGQPLVTDLTAPGSSNPAQALAIAMQRPGERVPYIAPEIAPERTPEGRLQMIQSGRAPQFQSKEEMNNWILSGIVMPDKTPRETTSRRWEPEQAAMIDQQSRAAGLVPIGVDSYGNMKYGPPEQQKPKTVRVSEIVGGQRVSRDIPEEEFDIMQTEQQEKESQSAFERANRKDLQIIKDYNEGKLKGGWFTDPEEIYQKALERVENAEGYKPEYLPQGKRQESFTPQAPIKEPMKNQEVLRPDEIVMIDQNGTPYGVTADSLPEALQNGLTIAPQPKPASQPRTQQPRSGVMFSAEDVQQINKEPFRQAGQQKLPTSEQIREQKMGDITTGTVQNALNFNIGIGKSASEQLQKESKFIKGQFNKIPEAIKNQIREMAFARNIDPKFALTVKAITQDEYNKLKVNFNANQTAQSIAGR